MFNHFPEYDRYESICRQEYSVRCENFHLLDLRLIHLLQMFCRYFTVLDFDAINVLNINNVFCYIYLRDYSDREEIQSYLGRRTVVFGVAVNL